MIQEKICHGKNKKTVTLNRISVGRSGEIVERVKIMGKREFVYQKRRKS